MSVHLNQPGSGATEPPFKPKLSQKDTGKNSPAIPIPELPPLSTTPLGGRVQSDAEKKHLANVELVIKRRDKAKAGPDEVIARLLQEPAFAQQWALITSNERELLRDRIIQCPPDTLENHMKFLRVVVKVAAHFRVYEPAIISGFDTTILYQAQPLLEWISNNLDKSDAGPCLKSFWDIMMLTPEEEWLAQAAFRSFKKGDIATGRALMQADLQYPRPIADLLYRAKEFPWEKGKDVAWAKDIEAWIKSDPANPIPYRFLVNLYILETMESRLPERLQMEGKGIGMTHIANALKSLGTALPDCHPRLLDLFDNNLVVFITLAELQKKMAPPEFAFFVENYLREPIEKTFGECFKISDILLKNPLHLENFSKLLIIEKKLGISLIPFFVKHPERLNGTLLIQSFEENPKFAERFAAFAQECDRLGSYAHPDAFQILLGAFKQNKKEILEIFDIVGHKRDLCYHMINAVLISKDNLKTVLDQCRGLKEMNCIDGYAKLLSYSPLLLTLIAKSPHVKELVRLAANGDLDTVKKLFDLSKLPKNQLSKRLIAQATAATLPLIRKILTLAPSDKLDGQLLDAIAKEPPNKPFNADICGLLALHSQENRKLLERGLEIASKAGDRRTPSENLIMEWIGAGRFKLAEDFAANGGGTFWKTVLALPLDKAESPLDNAVIQQFYDLNLSMKAMNAAPALWPNEVTQSLERFAFSLFKHAGANAAKEWISVLQFRLKSQPEEIRKMAMSEEWQKMGKSLAADATDKESIAAILKAYPNDFNTAIQLIIPPKINDRIIDYVRTLSNALITVGGALNVDFIEPFMAAYPWLYEAEHRHFVRSLAALKGDHYFSDRLEKVKAPPPNTRQSDLVRASVQKEAGVPLDANDSRQAILSALLWPLRQSNKVGSCFGTSVAIQQMSYADGMKQTLEDFLVLVSHGRLRRNLPGFPSIQVDYPMTYDKQLYEASFHKADHLALAREFTIASMAAENKARTTTLWTSWNSEIDLAVAPVEGELKAQGFSPEMICKVRDEIKMHFKTHADLRYLGHMQEPLGILSSGAWVLVNRSTNESIVKSLDAWEGFVASALNQWKKSLPSSGYTKGQAESLENILLPKLRDVVGSGEFVTRCTNIKSADIFASKVTNIPHCPPFVDYTGGYTPAAKSHYQATRVTLNHLPSHPHPLGRIFRYIEQLSAEEKMEALRNPSLLKTFSVPTHGMNLCVGTLVPLVLKAKGADALFDEWQKANEKLMSTPLDTILAIDILNKYFADPALNIHSPAMLEEMAVKQPKTVGELCQTIISFMIKMQGNMQAKEIAEMRLKGILYTVPGLPVPPIFDIVDTNWSEQNLLGYGISFGSPSTFGWGRYDWHPDTWEIIETPKTDDEYSRHYFIG